MNLTSRHPDLNSWLLLGLALLAVLVINPIGFLGGGGDDWQYLNAARCWRSHGPCLPQNHWQGRWPIIAPLAAIIQLFGESRLTVSIAPLAASALCLVLLALLGNRWLGRPVGFLAAFLLLTVPAFSIQLLDPSVEATELTFGLFSAFAIGKWTERGGRRWPLLAGLSMGLAVQVRETAAIAALLAGGFIAYNRKSAQLTRWGVALAGFLAPLLIEMLLFWVVAGDPFYRRRQGIAHTQIPSTELLGPIDRNHPPFFNPAYIAHWRREPGIHLHWLVDGLINFFANPKAGFLLGSIPVLLLFYRRLLGERTVSVIWRIYGAAMLYIGALIYALAVDPKPRMIVFSLAACALALASIIVALIRAKRLLVAGALLASHLGIGLFILVIYQRTFPVEAPARAWIARYPGKIETTFNTRRVLALVSEAQQLPLLSGRTTMFMVDSDVDCSEWQQKADPTATVIVDHVPMSRGRMLNPTLKGELCLFGLRRRMTGTELLAMSARAEPYGFEALKASKSGSLK